MRATRSNLKCEKSPIERQVRLLVFYDYAFLVLAPRALEGAPIVIRPVGLDGDEPHFYPAR